MGAFDKSRFIKFASDNQLEVKDYKINDLKQNEIFSENVLKRIFQQKDGEINLITNRTLCKSFLVMSIKTKYRDLKKGTKILKSHLESKKPYGHGIPANKYKDVVGKILTSDKNKWDFLKSKDLKNNE